MILVGGNRKEGTLVSMVEPRKPAGARKKLAGHLWVIGTLIAVIALLVPSSAVMGQGRATTNGAGAKAFTTGAKKAKTATHRAGRKAHVKPTRTAPRLTRRQRELIKDMNQEE